MFISTFADFSNSIQVEGESLYSASGFFAPDDRVFYITSATLGETNGHFDAALAEWREIDVFAGSIITSIFVPETGKTTLCLYAVMDTALNSKPL